MIIIINNYQLLWYEIFNDVGITLPKYKTEKKRKQTDELKMFSELKLDFSKSNSFIPLSGRFYVGIEIL